MLVCLLHGASNKLLYNMNVAEARCSYIALCGKRPVLQIAVLEHCLHTDIRVAASEALRGLHVEGLKGYSCI